MSKTGLTFRPVPSTDAASFLPKAKDGENSSVPGFLVIADLLIANYDTFSLADFFALSRSQDLPPEDIKELFQSWTERLLKAGRLKKISGAYDENIFVVCN